MKRLDPTGVSLLNSCAVSVSLVLMITGWIAGCLWASFIGGGLDGDPPRGVGRIWLDLLPFATAAGAASLPWFPMLVLYWRRQHLDRQETDPRSN
jgi:hypothetical protein